MAYYRLVPCGKDYIWGGTRLKSAYGKAFPGDKWAESWELSCHPDGEAMVGSGRFEGADLSDRISAERSAGRDAVGYAARGRKDFPLLVKLIDTGSDLSIQVHPDDAYAMAREGGPGKAEMWYVLDCEEGASICYGFKRAVTRAEVTRALEDESFAGLLNILPVHPGDVFMIEPGTVHAVGAGITLVEVEQSSNLSYRVYDYGRTDTNGQPRPLQIEKALDVMNFAPSRTDYDFAGHLCRCPAFTADKIALSPGEIWPCVAAGASFHYLLVTRGTCRLEGEDGVLDFGRGESVLVEANTGAFTLSGDGCVLHIYMEADESGKEYRVGIDLGGTNIDVGVIDRGNKLLAQARRKTGQPGRPVFEVINDMVDAVREALQAAGIAVADCAGIGVGCPGLTDTVSGTVVYTPNLGWQGVPLAAELERRLGIPARLSNDANCTALGEVRAGAAQNCKNAVLITLGTGVGGGIVIDGRLFEGGGPGGAELGHMTLVAGGEMCGCGRRGCLEAYASARALAREGVRAARKNPDSLLNALSGGDESKIDGEIIFAAAAAGDSAAQAVVEQYIRWLGDGVVDIINLLRPEKILLAGGVAQAGAALLEPLNRYVRTYAYAGDRLPVPTVEKASLGPLAGVIGAANLA